MKTIQDLFALLILVQLDNSTTKNLEVVPNESTWFFQFSGHVNQLSITFHEFGWSRATQRDHHAHSLNIYLDNDDQIQEAYYFIKNRLPSYLLEK
jgi:hypothetical protein